jgi:hypothetical protein
MSGLAGSRIIDKLHFGSHVGFVFFVGNWAFLDSLLWPESNRSLICCSLFIKVIWGHNLSTIVSPNYLSAKKALLLAEGISFASFHSL